MNRRPPSSLTVRALLALTMLAGVYLLGLALVGALVGANAWLLANGHVAVRFLVISCLLCLALLRGMFFIDRSARAGADGLVVDAQTQPELVAMVGELARAMHTRPPDEIRLVQDVNAFVNETGGMLGLRRGRRVLVLGIGLVNTLTVEELRGVLAHEMGHYAGGHAALGPLIYRTAESLHRIVGRLGTRSVLGRLFGAYQRVFLRLTQSMRRRMELEADANAVRIAGRDAFVSALRQVHAATHVFSYFIDRYVAPQWRLGFHPDNLFAGYRALFTDPGRAGEIADLCGRLEQEATDPYDSHPSLAERIAALGSDSAEGAVIAGDPRSARALFRDVDSVEASLGRDLSLRATSGRAATAVTWDEAAASVYGRAVEERARRALAAVALLDAGGGDAGLDRLLDAIAAGRGAELGRAIGMSIDAAGMQRQAAEAQERTVRGLLVAGTVSAALVHVAARVPGSRWRLNWAGPLRLVGPDGRDLDVSAAAERAATEPDEGIAVLRARIAALTGEGEDVVAEDDAIEGGSAA